MSGQQPNAWQTARSRQSASRTPQNRSGTASPSQQGNPTQPPRQERSQQQNNVWNRQQSESRERQAPQSASNGPMSVPAQQQDRYTPVNGFNAAEVKAFLGREAQALPSTYKTSDGNGGARAGGSAWAKPNVMANNQPFFVQLAKQVATLEDGG